jgi:hypothetical protein
LKLLSLQTMEQLPLYIPWTFGLTTLAALFLFARAAQKPASVGVVLLPCLIVQGGIALSNLYNANPQALPPAIVLFGVLPALLLVVLPFLIPKGRDFIDNLSISRLTFLHVVRVPVEIVLWWLSVYGVVPELITFEGRNWDIVAGLTAPFVAFGGRDRLGRSGMLAWNMICLGLLLNVVVHAFLSAPSPFQQMAYDQPNIAVLYFPFSWLPTFVVPVVLFAHLASIRQLLQR